jgi:hypothetical protein
MTNTINEGDLVLLYFDQRRTYLVAVEKGKTFHTHKGYIQLDALIGKEYGTRIASSLGVEFVALKPLLRSIASTGWCWSTASMTSATLAVVSISDFDWVIWMSLAFAAQALGVIKELELDLQRLTFTAAAFPWDIPSAAPVPELS